MHDYSAADIESLERATLDAVAPLQVEAIDGWLIPFDPSTIGRAKSAVPLRHEGLDAEDLPRIEARYRAHGLSPAFRLADRPALAPLQQRLRGMGFQAEQATLVQTGSVARMLAAFESGESLVSKEPRPDWAAVYTAAGFDPVDGAHRVQALSRSQSAFYASLQRDGQPVAAGVCAIGFGWASIHGMRTVVSRRGQGLAGQLLTALAGTARDAGLERMFLQVEEENHAALSLYRRAGFTTAWRYHYWRKP